MRQARTSRLLVSLVATTATATRRRGWPQNIEGHLERLDDETAVFTSAQIPIRLVFHPAPDAVWTCA